MTRVLSSETRRIFPMASSSLVGGVGGETECYCSWKIPVFKDMVGIILHEETKTNNVEVDFNTFWPPEQIVGVDLKTVCSKSGCKFTKRRKAALSHNSGGLLSLKASDSKPVENKTYILTHRPLLMFLTLIQPPENTQNQKKCSKIIKINILSTFKASIF